MFKTLIIEFGNTKYGNTHIAEFFYDESVDYICRVTTGCDCTSAKNEISKRAIIAEYTVKPIPVHLKMEGINSQDKIIPIEIEYVRKNYDGTFKQTLLITATVKG